MARPRVLPTNSELVEMRDRGLTHQQIADEVFRRTNQRIARSTVSVALMRAGEATHHKRYNEAIPWTVPAEYGSEYPLRMLRLLGRRQHGAAMTVDEEQRLESWLGRLRDNGEVVGFCPDSPDGEPGFHYLPIEAKDHDGPEPIRREEVRPEQIGYPKR